MKKQQQTGKEVLFWKGKTDVYEKYMYERLLTYNQVTNLYGV